MPFQCYKRKEKKVLAELKEATRGGINKLTSTLIKTFQPLNFYEDLKTQFINVSKAKLCNCIIKLNDLR